MVGEKYGIKKIVLDENTIYDWCLMNTVTYDFVAVKLRAKHNILELIFTKHLP